MKIVVVDDSMTVRMIIESLLEDLGIDEDAIVSFESGHEALEYLRHNRVDMLFTDINMPKMSGYELLSKMRREGLIEGITLFVISGEEDRAFVPKMKRLGAKQFIRKPIESHYFNHHVKRHIERLKQTQ